MGQTTKTVQERYEQHKNGIKSGRKWVMRYGIGLMEPLFLHLMNVSHDEALELEQDIAEALKEAGFVVKGGH